MLSDFLSPFIVKAILAGLGIAITSGFLGSFIVWQKMSYFGDSMAHSAMLGVGLGILIGLPNNLSIVVICVIFATILLWLDYNKTLSTDTILGILAHTSLAFGIILFTIFRIRFDLSSFLFGDILTVTSSEIYIIYANMIVTLIIIISNWDKFILIVFSEDLAKSEGINTTLFKIIQKLLIALIIAISVNIVGILLVTAMLIIPNASARLFANNPKEMVIIAVLFAVFSNLTGIILSIQIDIPTGPAIVAVLSTLFFFSLLLNTMLNKRKL